MADGSGVQEVAQAISLRLRSLKRIAHELFLVYEVSQKTGEIPAGLTSGTNSGKMRGMEGKKEHYGDKL